MGPSKASLAQLIGAGRPDSPCWDIEGSAICGSHWRSGAAAISGATAYAARQPCRWHGAPEGPDERDNVYFWSGRGGMAKLVLWGDTALEWHKRHDGSGVSATRFGFFEAGEVVPQACSLRYLGQQFPWLTTPVHVMVPRRSDRRTMANCRCHTAVPSMAEAACWHIAAGVYALESEVAYVQSCRGRSLQEAVAMGTLLCGSYRIDPVDDRVVPRDAVSSVEAIRLACLAHSDIPGLDTAKRALPWVLEGAASPREASLGLLLSLPCRLGGYGLPRPCLNYRIDLTARNAQLAHRAFYVADLCWPLERLVVEYDSDEYHLTSQRLRDDALKRMALEAAGYQVISVTRLQLNCREEMHRVARAAARKLGRTLRVRTQDYPLKQKKLCKALGLSAS